LVLLALLGCGGGSGTTDAVPGGTVSYTYTLTGLAPQTTYYLAVTAYDTSDVESVSNELSGESSSTGTITVAWDAITHPDLKGYRLHYGTAPHVPNIDSTSVNIPK
jgi:hypothetical protein